MLYSIGGEDSCDGYGNIRVTNHTLGQDNYPWFNALDGRLYQHEMHIFIPFSDYESIASFPAEFAQRTESVMRNNLLALLMKATTCVDLGTNSGIASMDYSVPDDTRAKVKMIVTLIPVSSKRTYDPETGTYGEDTLRTNTADGTIRKFHSATPTASSSSRSRTATHSTTTTTAGNAMAGAEGRNEVIDHREMVKQMVLDAIGQDHSDHSAFAGILYSFFVFDAQYDVQYAIARQIVSNKHYRQTDGTLVFCDDELKKMWSAHTGRDVDGVIERLAGNNNMEDAVDAEANEGGEDEEGGNASKNKERAQQKSRVQRTTSKRGRKRDVAMRDAGAMPYLKITSFSSYAYHIDVLYNRLRGKLVLTYNVDTPLQLLNLAKSADIDPYRVFTLESALEMASEHGGHEYFTDQRNYYRGLGVDNYNHPVAQFRSPNPYFSIYMHPCMFIPEDYFTKRFLDLQLFGSYSRIHQLKQMSKKHGILDEDQQRLKEMSKQFGISTKHDEINKRKKEETIKRDTTTHEEWSKSMLETINARTERDEKYFVDLCVLQQQGLSLYKLEIDRLHNVPGAYHAMVLKENRYPSMSTEEPIRIKNLSLYGNQKVNEIEEMTHIAGIHGISLLAVQLLKVRLAPHLSVDLRQKSGEHMKILSGPGTGKDDLLKKIESFSLAGTIQQISGASLMGLLNFEPSNNYLKVLSEMPTLLNKSSDREASGDRAKAQQMLKSMLSDSLTRYASRRVNPSTGTAEQYTVEGYSTDTWVVLGNPFDQSPNQDSNGSALSDRFWYETAHLHRSDDGREMVDRAMQTLTPADLEARTYICVKLKRLHRLGIDILGTIRTIFLPTVDITLAMDYQTYVLNHMTSFIPKLKSSARPVLRLMPDTAIETVQYAARTIFNSPLSPYRLHYDGSGDDVSDVSPTDRPDPFPFMNYVPEMLYEAGKLLFATEDIAFHEVAFGLSSHLKVREYVIAEALGHQAKYSTISERDIAYCRTLDRKVVESTNVYQLAAFYLKHTRRVPSLDVLNNEKFQDVRTFYYSDPLSSLPLISSGNGEINYEQIPTAVSMTMSVLNNLQQSSSRPHGNASAAGTPNNRNIRQSVSQQPRTPFTMGRVAAAAAAVGSTSNSTSSTTTTTTTTTTADSDGDTTMVTTSAPTSKYLINDGLYYMTYAERTVSSSSTNSSSSSSSSSQNTAASASEFDFRNSRRLPYYFVDDPSVSNQDFIFYVHDMMDKNTRDTFYFKSDTYALPDYKTERVPDSQEVFINPNYLCINGDVKEIAAALCGRIQHYEIGFEPIVSYLYELKKLYRTIRVMPLFRRTCDTMHEALLGKVIQSLKYNATYNERLPCARRPVAIIDEAEKRFYILTDFLDATPMRLIHHAIDSLCHAGTRERDVLLGVADPSFPGVYSTHHVRPIPGKHLTLIQPRYVTPTQHTLLTSNFLSKEGQHVRIDTERERPEVDLGSQCGPDYDIEQTYYLRFIKRWYRSSVAENVSSPLRGDNHDFSELFKRMVPKNYSPLLTKFHYPPNDYSPRRVQERLDELFNDPKSPFNAVPPTVTYPGSVVEDIKEARALHKKLGGESSSTSSNNSGQSNPAVSAIASSLCQLSLNRAFSGSVTPGIIQTSNLDGVANDEVDIDSETARLEMQQLLQSRNSSSPTEKQRLPQNFPTKPLPVSTTTTSAMILDGDDIDTSESNY